MITFIAFCLTILGCVNWLMIGLLQYDYIAGLFGFQASMFSRIIYILFGVAAAYLVLRVIINKGSFKVWEKKKKNATNQEQSSQEQHPSQIQLAYANVEAGQEAIPQNNSNFQNNSQSKKKKWWQFWKRSGKNEKQKFQQENSQEPTTQKMSPVDIDISLNATPENFNEQPTLEQPAQDNLFDEHLTH